MFSQDEGSNNECKSATPSASQARIEHGILAVEVQSAS